MSGLISAARAGEQLLSRGMEGLQTCRPADGRGDKPLLVARPRLALLVTVGSQFFCLRLVSLVLRPKAPRRGSFDTAQRTTSSWLARDFAGALCSCARSR